MAINRTSPKKGKVVDIPDAVVTIGTPTAGTSQVSVAFTATSPATGGPVQKYTAISNPGGFTGSATTSPVTVSGLTNGTAYTFQVAAANATGSGIFSSASASATPVMANSYESIATVNASGTSFSFTSIPQGYKHLQIRGYWDTSGGNGNLTYTVNGTGGTKSHYLYGYGSGVASGSLPYAYFHLESGGGQPYSAIFDLLDYSSTSKYKTGRSLVGVNFNGSGIVELVSSFVATTGAVASLTFTLSANSFASGSTFSLYGIKG